MPNHAPLTPSPYASLLCRLWLNKEENPTVNRQSCEFSFVESSHPLCSFWFFIDIFSFPRYKMMSVPKQTPFEVVWPSYYSLWAVVIAQVWGEGDFFLPLYNHVLKLVRELTNYFTCSHVSFSFEDFLDIRFNSFVLNWCAVHIFSSGIKILRAH